MKKLLLLGGSAQQVCAIEYANSRGFRTILCDYLPNNPGRLVADRFYCVSTTDQEEILKIAIMERIDGIVAYASDPAALTAAYVAEILGLPTNPLSAVEILSNKAKFRNFLKENDFNHPKAYRFNQSEICELHTFELQFPILVKPVDSSGSKGISLVAVPDDLPAAILIAQQFSRCGDIILEQYIQRDHPYVIGGDCFVINGRIVFWGLLNSHRDPEWKPFVPIGTSYPVEITQKRRNLLEIETQRMFDLLGIKSGAFNLEMMFDQYDRLFFIEIGPRNGGNWIPGFIKKLTSIDMIAATIETALGLNAAYVFEKSVPVNDEYQSNYVLRSPEDGIFDAIEIEESLRSKVTDCLLYKQPGQAIECFQHAGQAIGIIFFRFSSKDEMIEIMNQMPILVKVIVH